MRLGIDEDGITKDEKVPILAELHEAARAYTSARSRGRAKPAGNPAHAAADGHERRTMDGKSASGRRAGGAEPPETYRLADFFRAGSSKYVLVRMRGLEPPRTCVH